MLFHTTPIKPWAGSCGQRKLGLCFRFQCFCFRQALKFALSRQPGAVNRSELAPAEDLGRAILLNNAMVDLRVKSLVASEVGVKGALPQAVVADYVRSVAGLMEVDHEGIHSAARLTCCMTPESKT